MPVATKMARCNFIVIVDRDHICYIHSLIMSACIKKKSMYKDVPMSLLLIDIASFANLLVKQPLGRPASPCGEYLLPYD